MALNIIWIAFFLIAFVIALFKFIITNKNTPYEIY